MFLARVLTNKNTRITMSMGYGRSSLCVCVLAGTWWPAVTCCRAIWCCVSLPTWWAPNRTRRPPVWAALCRWKMRTTSIGERTPDPANPPAEILILLILQLRS